MKAIRSNLLFYLFAPSSLAMLIAGMGCQGMGNSTTPPAKTLTSVSVSPATASVSTGNTEQFTATAKYSDGSTANVSSTASWSVGSSAIAAISSTGLVTGKASGSTSVTASLSGMTGTASLDVQTGTVTKTLKSIALTPTSASVAPDATQQFTATGTYSDGSTANISTSATWSSASPSIATINSSGLATGVSGGSTTVSAALSGISSNAATISVVAVASITVTPTLESVPVGGQEQFTATATYSNGTQGNVTSSASWSLSKAGVANITPSGLATGIAAGSTGVTASLDGFSGSATLDVTASTNTGANIPMFHVDRNRSGLNSNETTLTPANVKPANFGKLFSYLVDGYVYGQPLLISNLTIGGTTHNVLFAATENDTVYAFDADSNAGSNANPLWKTPLLQTGETPITNGPIQPVEGVTSTPAIDTTTNTMYVVSAQSSAAGGTFRLNALDITTGNQQPGSPITLRATVAGTNDTTLGTDCLQRAALLVLPGSPASVFIGFASCHSGWLLAYAYDGATFTQTGVFNSSPNLTGEGTYASAGGIWMGGGGPVSDGNYVYVSTGNGPWEPSQQAYGDSVLKFTQSLQLEDYFTPFVYAYMDCADADLAAGGLLLIPGTTELLAGGKTGKLYLVNSDNLGQEQNNDTGATQTLWFEDDLNPPYEATCPAPSNGTVSGSADINSYEIFGTAAYFNGSAYLGITPTASLASNGIVRQFPYSGTLSHGSYSQPNILQSSYGTTPFISAAPNNSNGILWMLDHGQPLQSGSTQTNSILRAYDANNLASPELYSSSTNSGDVPGYGIKFTAPIVANGKVYISTGHDLTTATNPQGELDVYGLK